MTFYDPASLVGRENELRELDAAVSEAHMRSDVAVVRIVGPSGIGKTAYLQAVASRYAIGRVGIAGALPSDAATPELYARRLAASIETPTSTGGIDDALAAAAVLCIDDLQWVDELSLRSIGTAIRTSGILKIVLAADRRENAAGLGRHQMVRLDAMSPQSSALIVTRRYPAAPDDVVDEIVRVCAGSPFALAVLSDDAASRAARQRRDTSPSVRTAITKRLDRCEPGERDLIRLSALVDGVADVRAIARSNNLPISEAARLLGNFSDLLNVDGLAVTFKHALLRNTVLDTIPDPVSMYQRLLDAYAVDEHAIDGEAAILRCAVACGDDARASSYALRIARRASAAGAAETALRFLKIALRHTPVPTPAEYAVEYATALSHLARDVEAATFLRRELRNAIENSDASRAAELATSFASIALTLEDYAEIETVCTRIASLPTVDERSIALLRTARLATYAFSAQFDSYALIAAERSPLPADRRTAAFVAAWNGEPTTARTEFGKYQAQLRSVDARQEQADRVLHAFLALHETGNKGVVELENAFGPVLPDETYQGPTHIRLVARIHAGRWDEAADLIARLPLWDDDYEESVLLLGTRLQLDALRGRTPLQHRRTLRAIRALIGRGQTHHAVAPARWYMVAAGRCGFSVDADVSGFVEETLALPPMPYLISGIPLAIAFLSERFGDSACIEALDRWPEPRSRWNRAHYLLAHALLTRDVSALRNVRDEFQRLGAPIFAMIAGLALPAPRERDVSLGHALGYLPRNNESVSISLTVRESDIAELIAQGMTNREIGSKLHIKDRTVETHLSNVFRKLGVSNRTDLARRILSGSATTSDDR